MATAKKTSVVSKKVTKKALMDYFDKRFDEVFGYSDNEHAFSDEYAGIKEAIDNKYATTFEDIDSELDAWLETFLAHIQSYSEKPNATPQKEWDTLMLEHLKSEIEYATSALQIAKDALKDYKDELKAR